MSKNILEKLPHETRAFNMSFENKMSTDETIISIDVVVSTPADTINIISTGVTGQNVQLLISGGTAPNRPDVDYNDFKITVEITTSNGQVLENNGNLRIQKNIHT